MSQLLLGVGSKEPSTGKRDHRYCAHLFGIYSLQATGLGGDAGIHTGKTAGARDRQLFSILGGGFHWFPSVLVHCCCCNKSSQTQWSKQYKCILLQLWRLKSPVVWQGCFLLEVRGVGGGVSSPCPPVRGCPFLAGGPGPFKPRSHRHISALSDPPASLFKDALITLSPSGSLRLTSPT